MLAWKLLILNGSNDLTSRETPLRYFDETFQKQPPKVLWKGKRLCQSLSFDKVAGGGLDFILKKILAQVFYKFCEIFISTVFTLHIWWLLLTFIIKLLCLKSRLCLITFLLFTPNFIIRFSAGIYLFKFNKGNTGTMCEMCSELMMKTPERRHWHCFDVFILTLNGFHTLIKSLYWYFEQLNTGWVKADYA